MSGDVPPLKPPALHSRRSAAGLLCGVNTRPPPRPRACVRAIYSFPAVRQLFAAARSAASGSISPEVFYTVLLPSADVSAVC